MAMIRDRLSLFLARVSNPGSRQACTTKVPFKLRYTPRTGRLGALMCIDSCLAECDLSLNDRKVVCCMLGNPSMFIRRFSRFVANDKRFSNGMGRLGR